MRYISHRSENNYRIIKVAESFQTGHLWWRKTCTVEREYASRGRGSTVWYHFPDFKRAGTSTESALSDINTWLNFRSMGIDS